MAMEFDVPIFKKCCFCIPLRPGLLVWGYLKLLASLLLILMLGVIDISLLDVALMILMCISVINFVFTIVFVIGVHRKHEKLISVYYKFTIVLLILNAIAAVGNFVFQLIQTVSSENFNYYVAFIFVNVIFKDLLVHLLDMVLQGYLLMLIRSHLSKLRDCHRVEFTNNAANAPPRNIVVTITEKK